MKKNYLLLTLATLLSIFIISCEQKSDPTDPSGTDTTNAVTLTGQIVSSATGENLSGAIVKISDGNTVKGASTNSEGKFSTRFEIENDIDLQVITFKAGYFQDTTIVLGIVNATVEVPLIKLDRDESSNAGDFSGRAASIYLASQTDQSVGVKESGSLESMQITFEIMDSSGVVIGENNSINVSFRFGSSPGGGEYLYPASATSNALGRVSVSLNTGTIAGVAQVIAEAVVDGKPIASKPVMVAIHGGFPDAGHFHVASKKLNYPKLGVIGFPIEFTTYLGDKYSNPVREKTAVYFKTNSGIIEGSALTGSLGTGQVTLLTQPLPEDPEYGAGFFRVTATTINEDNNYIDTETIRLQSGPPIINVNPSTFTLSNGGSTSFSYTIADINGNPMAEGQSVSVSAESEFYKVAGGTSIKFPDTQSKSWTTFSFVVFDSNADTTFSEVITIKIESSGDNGKGLLTFSGTGE